MSLASLTLLLFLYTQSHPLIGEWESKRGEKIGPVMDVNAPYSLIFKENTMELEGKVITIDYLLEINKKNSLYVKSVEYGGVLEVKCLENGKIQFYFPKIGLRRYSRKNNWNFFSRCYSKH